MTSFVFRVRNVPAALYKAMGGFATNGINMTKLESYMVDGQFSATQFYADVEGTRRIATSSSHWRNSPSSRRNCAFSAPTRRIPIARKSAPGGVRLSR